MSETTYGRVPLQIVEIEQPFCNLEYGVSPCAAELGVTGEKKCFNTAVSCQDTANFDPDPLLLRFCKPGSNPPKGVFCVPSLMSVSTSPTEINVIGGSKNKSPLGVRAQVSVSFKDHPYNDQLVDKYRDERSYIATDNGTYWGKWLARNPFYNDYVINIYDGYEGQTIGQMQKRTYLVDAVSGPDSNQTFNITAKDVLKLADDEKAQAPIASTGELIVSYTESETITSLRVTNAVAADYPAPGKVRINSEVMSYTGVTTIDATEINLDGIVRATDGTTAQSHDAEDRVQLCLEYTNARPDEITEDLLLNYGNVPIAYIPTTAWDAEASIWLEQFRVSTIITEPTSVTDLLGEITEQLMFYIWWDEREQLINLKALRPASGDPITPVSDTNNIIADTFGKVQKPKERISQVWLFFQQRDPTEKLDDEQNYRKAEIRIDANAESSLEYGDRRIKKIYSRWIQTSAVATQTTVRVLARFRNTPEYLSFSLDAKDRQLWTGDLADVTCQYLTDDTGQPFVRTWQVVSAEEVLTGERIEYKMQTFEYTSDERFGFWTPPDAPTFDTATEAEKATLGFWSQADGTMLDGSDGYTWQ